MERIKLNKLQIYSQLVSRALLASKLGQSFGGDRDLYQALGYKQTLNFQDYFNRYERQDIAKAIIDRPVNATWQEGFSIIEENDEKKTELENAWNKLEEELHIVGKLIRVDKLSGIGTYGVLFLGFNDVTSVEQFKQPVGTGNRKLLYIKPFSSKTAKIETYIKDTRNKRYGLPETYAIDLRKGETVIVHWTRIIHIVDDILEDEVEGMPRMEAVFNRLQDLEKLIGGDAEMFWKGARPGYTGQVDKDYEMTPDVKKDLVNQIDEFEHNLRRMLVNEGVTYKALEQQIADPSSHVDIQIQMISAVTQIPKRILTGSERGELSSSQDKSEWLTYISNRRETFVDNQIIRQLVDRLILYGVLPKPINGQYTIQWNDLFALSDKEKVEIGKIRATALKEYTSSPMLESIVPPDMFLTYFLGLKDEQITMLQKAREKAMNEEGNVTEEENKIIEEE